MTTPTHDADCRGAAAPPGESCCDQEHARWLAAPTPAPLTDADLAAIEARANAATAGPWQQTHDIARGVKLWGRDGEPLFSSIAGLAHSRVSPADPVPQWQKNVDFARNARTDVPALVAEVRRLRARYETPGITCNSGHVNVLPVKLWDCPMCVEALRRKLADVQERARRYAQGLCAIDDADVDTPAWQLRWMARQAAFGSVGADRHQARADAGSAAP